MQVAELRLNRSSGTVTPIGSCSRWFLPRGNLTPVRLTSEQAASLAGALTGIVLEQGRATWGLAGERDRPGPGDLS